MIDDLRTMAPTLLGHSQSLTQAHPLSRHAHLGMQLRASGRQSGAVCVRSSTAPTPDICSATGTESAARRLPPQTGAVAMRRPKPQLIRNKLDLTDRAQVRLVKKRLGLSDAELIAIVGRIGNSIPAISKEAALQKANAPSKPADVEPIAATAPTS
ncbi:hypothetical protein ABH992_000479 [Bradyrhizobium yuanmingense]|uniref:DUF3606 domain-containing protein n=2 Tax=Bradyrhizobium yuanmingense TaxID=108015 RepID=A0ABV4GAH2_9BRAD